MKYFTPERFVALQDLGRDEIMDAADARWEEAVDQYDTYFRSVEALLPAEYRRLHDTYYLHDGLVLYMAHHADWFDIVVRLDPPPRQVLQLTYVLSGEAVIHREVLPAEHRGTGQSVAWLHDEIELVCETPLLCMHSILLSNGWEVRLPFQELFVQEVEPLIPAASSGHAKTGSSSVLTPSI